MSSDQIGMYLTDFAIYLANGLLVIVYWLVGNVPALVSIVCAAPIYFLTDQELQVRAGYRPMRGDRGGDLGVGSTIPRTAQITTAIALGLWLVAQWGMAMPVPWIGGVMWLAAMVVIFMMPAQRINVSWLAKTGLIIYVLCVLASRIYLAYTSTLTSDQWAALIGSSESAAMVIASTRGSVTTIVLWALWLVAPLGFFTMLIPRRITTEYSNPVKPGAAKRPELPLRTGLFA